KRQKSRDKNGSTGIHEQYSLNSAIKRRHGKITKTAKSFYNITNIKLNPNKPMLVTNTKDKIDTIKCKEKRLRT
ncbi:23081_t:CDS:1, partial [Gigaspora rosea]